MTGTQKKKRKTKTSKNRPAKATPAKKTSTKKISTHRKSSKKLATKKAAGTRASERIDAMIAELGDWRGDRLAEIRRLIHEVDPGVIEEWKWMGSPVWSHEGMYAVGNAHKNKVKITFHHGAQLDDPDKLFNAGLEGNKWRAIDVFEGDKIDEAALKRLLRAAIAYNETHSVPKSKGSRA